MIWRKSTSKEEKRGEGHSPYHIKNENIDIKTSVKTRKYYVV